MTLRKWTVCISAEFDDVEIEAETYWYGQDNGWLVFSRTDKKGAVAVFAPGKWVSFVEVT